MNKLLTVITTQVYNLHYITDTAIEQTYNKYAIPCPPGANRTELVDIMADIRSAHVLEAIIGTLFTKVNVNDSKEVETTKKNIMAMIALIKSYNSYYAHYLADVA
jgi:hypothetical protein